MIDLTIFCAFGAGLHNRLALVHGSRNSDQQTALDDPAATFCRNFTRSVFSFLAGLGLSSHLKGALQTEGQQRFGRNPHGLAAGQDLRSHSSSRTRGSADCGTFPSVGNGANNRAQPPECGWELQAGSLYLGGESHVSSVGLICVVKIAHPGQLKATGGNSMLNVFQPPTICRALRDRTAIPNGDGGVCWALYGQSASGMSNVDQICERS